MNRFVLPLFTATALITACGSDAQTPSTVSETVAPELFSTLSSAKMELAGVRVVAGPQGSFRSVAQVAVTVNCSQKIESFTSTVEAPRTPEPPRPGSGDFVVFASTIVSNSANWGGAVCMGMTTETFEVTLTGGVVSADQVKLVQVKPVGELRTNFRRDAQMLVPPNQVTLADAKPCEGNCLPGSTTLTIESIRTCVQEEGPTSVGFEVTPEGLVLGVSVLAIGQKDGQPPVCDGLFPQTVTVTVRTPRAFAMDEIKVRVLQ
jgi:hypothetical protein